MEIIFILIGLIAGSIFAFFVLKSKFKSKIDVAEERTRIFEEQNQNLSAELNAEREKVLELNSALSSLKADYNNLQKTLSEQKEETEKLQEKFAAEFENLANKILEEKSSKFTLQNKENLDQILKPLGEKIKEFEKKVNEVYVTDSKERASLATQLKNLQELNQMMAKEANNLTNALKGETKTMGNWGEFILESILEKSGLVKGREYKIQENFTNEEGRRLQPDVVVNLPDNKCIIIDSKVSLLAYENYSSSESDNQRANSLKEHINSIKRHIKDLSSKNYQNIYQIKSLDFVLLFMPVEPAFSLAIQNDTQLFNEAFDKNIVIVSPSTLLATLRTIANIWRQEYQNSNVLEIAKQSGALYDKFQGLLSDLIELGKRMNTMQNSYEGAMKKLYSGRGNLIISVENIKKLGAKTSKSLPQSIIDRASDSDEKFIE
ncbi:MAG: DNA recombination protein RmuC [Ignavibacteriaceae bacterium]